MTGFTKLFNSIIGSTIWREDSDTKVVWVTMLAMADRDGIVEGSVPGLANFAGVSIGQTEAALQKFLAPDSYSRSPEHEGRRIAVVEGGWRLLNYAKYRLKMSPEDIRERDRVRKAQYRELLKCPTQGGTTRDNTEMSAKSNTETETETETEIETKTEKKEESKTKPRSALAFVLPNWIPEKPWTDYLEMRRKLRKPMTQRSAELAVGELKKLQAAGDSPEDVLNQSILCGYTGLFPLKAKKSSAIPVDAADYYKGWGGALVSGDDDASHTN